MRKSHSQSAFIRTLVLLAVSGSLGACAAVSDAPPDPIDGVGIGADGAADGWVVYLNAAEAEAVLRLVNRPLVTLADVDAFRTLLETRVHPVPVASIIEYRLGPDELPGGPSSDDPPDLDLQALDNLDYVGRVTMGRLLDVAMDEGLYVVPSGVACRGELINSYADLLNIEQTGCTRVDGILNIGLSRRLPPDQRQLEALSALVQVDSLLISSAPGLEGLSGLRSLAEANRIVIAPTVGRELADLRGLEALRNLDSLTVSEVGSLRGLVGIEQLSSLNLSGVGDISALSTLRTAGDVQVRGEAVVGGFDSLEEISGNLRLGVPPLGLFPRLRSVGGTLAVESPVANLDGLGTLEHIGGNVWVSSAFLVDFRGLEGLQAIGGALSVTVYESLDSFDGLDSLTRVGGFVVAQTSFGSRSRQLDMQALRALTYVGGDFTIRRFDFQTSLRGFGALTTIEGDLDLRRTGITSFEDFSGMIELGGNLEVPRDMPQPAIDAFIGSLDHFTGELIQ